MNSKKHLIGKKFPKILLNKKKFSLLKEFSHGRSSQIFLVKDSKGKILKLKKEKDKSTRINMVKKEAENLKKANSTGVGPKLVDFNESEKWVLMEFIEGKTLAEFLEGKPTKKQLISVLNSLFAQAKALDEIGLDHGQLAGRLVNILVTKKFDAKIIDFEKASTKRKPHNLNVLKAMLFFNKNSFLAKKTREIFEKEIEEKELNRLTPGMSQPK